MSTDRARALVAKALNLPDVAATDGIGNLPAWDSLGHMHVILALEAELGGQLDAGDIAGLLTVADVSKILSQDAAE